jgi:hypothetical protein
MFQRIGGGRVADIESEVDPGRFLQIVFFVDGLDGFLQDGLAGANSDPSFLSLALNEHLKRGSARAKERTGFRDGISLLVGCGFGRGLNLVRERSLPDHWRLETISAYDLVTLSWVSGFDRLSLWRLLDSRQAIEREGPSLLNINGLLNLVASSRQLDGHLVPHGKLPDGFVEPGTQALIVIPQNAIRELRHAVMTEWNPRRVLDSDGRWLKVRKLDKSEFDEDNNAPFYGSEDDLRRGRLRGVYVARKRPWWVGITAPKHAPRDAVFSHWMMLCTWLRRAAPILDEAYTSLPAGPVSYDVSFREVLGTSPATAKPRNADELRSLIHPSVEAGSSRIRIEVAEGFDDGLIQPENIAERTLVEALVAGAAGAADELGDTNKRGSLVDRICPNPQARYQHRFQARSFRDFVHSEISSNPILIDSLDDGASRIGLGWRVLSRDSSPEISGVPECTSYLNDVVHTVLDDLCAELKCLDRCSFARAVLHNHEAAAHDRDRWSRSAEANVAMHEDKDAAVRTIVKRQSQLNACFLTCRILLEAAICQCPLEGGRTPGRLDLSRLMSRVMSAHYLGGWSDAIRWGAMEPRLRITPLGDVHMKPSYMNAVYEPFGRLGGEVEVRRATESYATLYAPVEARSSIADVFDPQFLSAWEAEFGASLDGVRAFVDKLEDLGRQPPKAILQLPHSALATMFASAAGISLEDASVPLDMLTSVPRPNWRVVGAEYRDKDWYPWRFRRRLSILRRPLIQMDSAKDPNIIFAPGLVREAFAAMVHWFHSGEIPSSQARSAAMCKWIGQANNVHRVEFNSTVARRMAELGWQVGPEIKLTKILGRSLDRDYGDIDVLAWRPDSGRVLVIEC